MKKASLNYIYCKITYEKKLLEQGRHSIIPDDIQIIVDGISCTAGKWFVQPDYISSLQLTHFAFIDPSHILTCHRSLICRKGIPERGIKTEAWLSVAQDGKSNGSNLNMSHVDSTMMVDKQKVIIAEKMFSGCDGNPRIWRGRKILPCDERLVGSWGYERAECSHSLPQADGHEGLVDGFFNVLSDWYVHHGNIHQYVPVLLEKLRKEHSAVSLRENWEKQLTIERYTWKRDLIWRVPWIRYKEHRLSTPKECTQDHECSYATGTYAIDSQKVRMIMWKHVYFT